MAVSSFAAGIISSGFSASTGLKINNPIPAPDQPPSRRCSVCGVDNCIGHEISCIRWIASWFSTGWILNAARPQPVPHAARRYEVVTGADDAQPQAQTAPEPIKLSVKDLFSMTSMTMEEPTRAPVDDSVQSVRVHVLMLKRNARVTLDVNYSSTVEGLRRKAARKLAVPRRQLMLIFNGTQLEDHEEIKYLGFDTDCTILAMNCYPGQQMGIYELDPSTLDPKYDFDFTNLSDDGKTYRRGGHVYHRPYWWRRYAVKVLGEYENDVWLGGGGIRTESTPGEWAVSYHGTARGNVRPILEEGYKTGRGQRFGRAIYTSPSWENVAQHYAKTFRYEGKTYKFVLQNRVDPDPDHLIVIPPEKTGYADFPYWLSPMQKPETGIHHVRPYGILTREV